MEDPSSFMNMMILTIFLHIDSTTQTSCMQGDESPGSDSDVFSISSRRTLQKTTTAVVSFLKKLPCHQNQLTFSPRKINIESNLNNDGNFGRLIFRTSRGPIIILRFQPLIFLGVVCSWYFHPSCFHREKLMPIGRWCFLGDVCLLFWAEFPQKKTDWRCVCVCYVYKSVCWVLGV